jgi:hypothetical protein
LGLGIFYLFFKEWNETSSLGNVENIGLNNNNNNNLTQCAFLSKIVLNLAGTGEERRGSVNTKTNQSKL